MSDNITKFQGDIEKLCSILDASIVEVTKTLAIEAFNGITELTPVRTGRARASWALAVGTPSDFVPDELPKGTVSQFNAAANKGTELAPVFGKPDVDFDAVAQIDGTQPVYITSNLVYMEALENGHSQQAPAGMVRITVAALEIGMDRLIAANTP